MEYFAYENWRAHGHVTKVHLSGCPFCNDGQGVGGGTRADNGQWHQMGNFDSPVAALAAVRTRITSGTVRLCGTCS